MEFRIDGNVFLAPMAGITDMSFRYLCKQMGASLVYSEMVSAKGMYYNSKNTEALIRFSESERPIAVQIFGSEPCLMADMAKRLELIGVDIIDINMGCPAPKIVKNGEGSALMRNPQLIGSIVKNVSSAVNIPVTIKIRKGYDSSSINAVQCAKIAEQNGASAVAVHGRTRAQQYAGRVDLNIIKEVKQSVSIPVIGNGDIVDGKTAKTMLDETGCDYIMVGRASCGNPWIFREINDYLKTGKECKPDINEKKRVIKCHAIGLCELKGEKTAMLEMRRHMSYYVKGIKGASKLRSKINSVHKLSELVSILDCLDE